MIERTIPAPKKPEIDLGKPYFSRGMIKFVDVKYPKLDEHARDATDTTNLIKRSLAEIPDLETKKRELLESLPLEERGSAKDFFTRLYTDSAPEALLATTPIARTAIEQFLETHMPQNLQQLREVTSDLLEIGGELRRAQLEMLRSLDSIPGLTDPEAYAKAVDRFGSRMETLGYTRGASRT